MRITKARDTLRHEAQAAEATRPGRGSLGTRGAPGLGLRSPVRVDSGRPAERAVRDPTAPSSWNAVSAPEQFLYSPQVCSDSTSS